MSRVYLQPSISTWKDNTDPFIASFIAYDDEGKRICRKQLYIEYAITYDGSVPDLENDSRTIYSNKDGVIELHFDKACRVSINVYMVEHYDETLDLDTMADNYICQNICNDLFLPFEPYIKDFSVKYISDVPTSVNNEIPRKYVQVTILQSDETTLRFTLEKEIYDDYILTPDTILHTNDNTVTVSYYDSLLDKTWEYDIIVIGKAQEVSIEAIYLGDTKQLNNLVPKTEISVKLTIFDGELTSIVPLSITEWEFTSFPQVTNKNLGKLKIQHNDLQCEVTIPFVWITYKYRIDAWYEGYPVKVGEKLVPDDFRIYLYKENGLRQMIPLNQCDLMPNDYTIHNKGLNWFTVLFRLDSFTLQDKVAIMGYEDPIYPEGEFQIWYYDKSVKTLVNMTESFRETCTIGDRIYFNWNRIRNRITELAKYGTYKLYAPVLTGLSTRCDTEWLINCKNRKAINAQLIKQYLEEEEENGNSENNNNENDESNSQED